MQVNTKKVQGRRKVRYESLDELLTDARRLSGVEVHMLGNWLAGQIYQHLAQTLDASIDGFSFSMPAPVRWIMTLLMKKKFLNKELPAGFKSTGKFIPEETSAEKGFASLQKAIERQKQVTGRVPHPGFGRISRDEWNDFHLRHAEMHMSFLIDRQSTEV